MAIYGLNFGAGLIPGPYRRMFSERRRLFECKHPVPPGAGRVGGFGDCPECKGQQRIVWFRLQGVATTKQEMDVMVITASNGIRKIHVEERATATPTGKVWGIFTY